MMYVFTVIHNLADDASHYTAKQSITRATEARFPLPELTASGNRAPVNTALVDG